MEKMLSGISARLQHTSHRMNIRFQPKSLQPPYIGSISTRADISPEHRLTALSHLELSRKGYGERPFPTIIKEVKKRQKRAGGVDIHTSFLQHLQVSSRSLNLGLASGPCQLRRPVLPGPADEHPSRGAAVPPRGTVPWPRAPLPCADCGQSSSACRLRAEPRPEEPQTTTQGKYYVFCVTKHMHSII